MMCVHEEGPRGRFQKLLLDLENRLARCQPNSVGESENVGVDRNGGLTKGGVQDHIGGFSSNTRESLQSGPISGNFPIMFSHQLLTKGDDVFRLAVKQANGADKRAESCFPQTKNRLWRIGRGKKDPCGLVDAFIGRLCRENHGNQELKRRRVKKFGFGRRNGFSQTLKNSESLFCVHF
ncbi:MAG: hypothetical protein RLZZ627_1678 [Pseudomonadota bacterium]